MFRQNLIYSLIIITFYSTVGYADCTNPVTFLTKNSAAPCDGYLFSPEKERELRLINEDNKYLKQESELKDQLINNYKVQVDSLQSIADKEQQKANLWQQKAEDITEKYTSEENNRSLRDWLFLVGGVLLTVGAGYAVGAAHK